MLKKRRLLKLYKQNNIILLLTDAIASIIVHVRLRIDKIKNYFKRTKNIELIDPYVIRNV